MNALRNNAEIVNCLAEAPELLRITRESFFRMANISYENGDKLS
jgi:hypothetical protein